MASTNDTTIAVTLPERLQQFVVAESAKRGFTSAGDYVQALVEAEERRQSKERLEQALLEGIRSGDATPMTAEDWQDIRQRVAARRGNEPRA